MRTTDLRFTSEEVAQWLTEVINLPLSSAQINALTRRTEGWIAALCLVVLSLRESEDRARHVAQFTGSHRYIIDYLLEEVLAHQPEEVRTFLLLTACLDRFTGPLCEAVTERSDGQVMLEALEQANLG